MYVHVWLLAAVGLETWDARTSALPPQWLLVLCLETRNQVFSGANQRRQHNSENREAAQLAFVFVEEWQDSRNPNAIFTLHVGLLILGI